MGRSKDCEERLGQTGMGKSSVDGWTGIGRRHGTAERVGRGSGERGGGEGRERMGGWKGVVDGQRGEEGWKEGEEEPGGMVGWKKTLEENGKALWRELWNGKLEFQPWNGGLERRFGTNFGMKRGEEGAGRVGRKEGMDRGGRRQEETNDEEGMVRRRQNNKVGRRRRKEFSLCT